MQLRLRYVKGGPQVRVAVFVAPDPGATYSNVGNLMFTAAEFAWLKDHLSADPAIEFVPFTKEIFPGEPV